MSSRSRWPWTSPSASPALSWWPPSIGVDEDPLPGRQRRVELGVRARDRELVAGAGDLPLHRVHHPQRDLPGVVQLQDLAPARRQAGEEAERRAAELLLLGDVEDRPEDADVALAQHREVGEAGKRVEGAAGEVVLAQVPAPEVGVHRRVGVHVDQPGELGHLVHGGPNLFSR